MFTRDLYKVMKVEPIAGSTLVYVELRLGSQFLSPSIHISVIPTDDPPKVGDLYKLSFTKQ